VPARRRWWFSLLFACFRSLHLVFDRRLLGNPDVLLVFVRDSRVRNWLWLRKLLAPLTHPYQREATSKCWYVIEVLMVLSFHQISGIHLPYKLIILNHEEIKILNSFFVFFIHFFSFVFIIQEHIKKCTDTYTHHFLQCLLTYNYVLQNNKNSK
jgi:hypothetical protein